MGSLGPAAPPWTVVHDGRADADDGAAAALREDGRRGLEDVELPPGGGGEGGTGPERLDLAGLGGLGAGRAGEARRARPRAAQLGGPAPLTEAGRLHCGASAAARQGAQGRGCQRLGVPIRSSVAWADLLPRQERP
jgi:hypothetical protein